LKAEEPKTGREDREKMGRQLNEFPFSVGEVGEQGKLSQSKCTNRQHGENEKKSTEEKTKENNGLEPKLIKGANQRMLKNGGGPREQCGGGAESGQRPRGLTNPTTIRRDKGRGKEERGKSGEGKGRSAEKEAGRKGGEARKGGGRKEDKGRERGKSKGRNALEMWLGLPIMES